ncbi:Ig-like domain-containing protein (plasmid) [Paenibacillus cellulosilyticus]|nr:Ig-like domain-containing protein [Paenibacillus cellulosilyticus]
MLLALLVTISCIPSQALAADTVSSLSFDTSASSITIYVSDDAYYLNLYATLSDSTTQTDVTDSASWKSSNTAVAKVSLGVITGVSAGTAKISATYGGYTKSITVNVEYVFDSVAITQVGSSTPANAEVKVSMGDTIEYSLVGTKSTVSSDIASEDVSWSSSNTAVATIEEGELTLLAEGTTTITAAYKGKTSKVKLTVSSPYKSITLSDTDLIEFTVGDSDYPLVALATLQDGTTSIITEDAEWTSSNTTVAKVEDGVITPGSTGTATITVSHLGATDSVTVAVRAGSQTLKLTPSKNQVMQLSDSPLTLTAQALEYSNSTTDVTSSAEWTSSDVMVATVSKGIVTPKGTGTTTITVTYKGTQRSLTVTVYPTVSDLSIDEDDQTIETYLEQTGSLPEVLAKSFSGDEVTVTSLLNWESSNESVVTVEDGKWKAVGTGTATLTGSINGYSIDVKINVSGKPLTLLVDSSTLSMIIGTEYAYPTVTLVYENGDEADVTDKITWKSSSTNLVVKSSTLKGLASSNATLTGSYLGKTVKISATIEEEVVKLVADPTSLTLNPKKSKSIKVKAFYKSGKSSIVSTKVSWSITDEAVAEFSGKNTVKALSKGTAVITGTYQSKTVTITLSVVPKLKTLVLSEKSLKLGIGETKTLKLKAFYDDGTYIDQTANAEWTSSNVSVVTVDSGILVTKAKGSASIKAKVEGKTITLRVTVK